MHESWKNNAKCDPQSIYEETLRIHLLRLRLIEAGLNKYMNDEDLKDLVECIIWADLDLLVPIDEWLSDLKRTVEWLLKLGKSPKTSGSSKSSKSSRTPKVLSNYHHGLLCQGVRNFGARVHRRIFGVDDE